MFLHAWFYSSHSKVKNEHEVSIYSHKHNGTFYEPVEKLKIYEYLFSNENTSVPCYWLTFPQATHMTYKENGQVYMVISLWDTKTTCQRFIWRENWMNVENNDRLKGSSGRWKYLKDEDIDIYTQLAICIVDGFFPSSLCSSILATAKHNVTSCWWSDQYTIYTCIGRAWPWKKSVTCMP